MQTQKMSQMNMIIPDNPKYREWNERDANIRFKGRPSAIIPVATIEELSQALQETIDKNLYLAVRGGGHCLEDFVANPAVEVVIDVSMMKGIRYDREINAIEVMAGVTVGELHEKLYNDWKVVLPTGEHPDIGIGGHIPGGAFGFLCRQHGLAVDYLYAVELLWVNESRKVEKVIATRESENPYRELWWAHTGGGAWNFGIVTRYWFRSPLVSAMDPEELLPLAPESVEMVEVDWLWEDISETGFQTLVRNFGVWSEKNAEPDSPNRFFFATLHLWNKSTGKIQMKGLVTEPGFTDLILLDLMNTLNLEHNIPYRSKRTKLSWLEFALHPFPDIFGDVKGAFKMKDAFLLKPFSAAQVKIIYNHLTGRTDTPGGFIAMATYGGKVNSIASDSTASFQRRAILTSACVAGWRDPAEEEKYFGWVRTCYQELFSNSGGVPVPGESSGGCIIAHPDNDMRDPAWNKSGIPWYTFYYQDNYPRLQEVKAKWDPLNIFHHALSVELVNPIKKSTF
jgi:hypothetical protein